jgi:hypothetical protein
MEGPSAAAETSPCAGALVLKATALLNCRCYIFEPESTTGNMRSICFWLTSPVHTMFTCTLGRRKVGKHISSRRRENSAKFQRLMLILRKLWISAACTLSVSYPVIRGQINVLYPYVLWHISSKQELWNQRKQLLGNGGVTRNSGITVGSGFVCCTCR